MATRHVSKKGNVKLHRICGTEVREHGSLQNFPAYAVRQPPKVMKKFDALANSLINVILISCPIHQLCMLLTAGWKQRKYFSEAFDEIPPFRYQFGKLSNKL